MTRLSQLLVGESGGSDSAAQQRALASSLRNRLGRGGKLHVMNVAIGTDDIAAALGALLATPIGHLALEGYRDHRAISSARERTREHPGGREALRLLEHTMRLTHRPLVRAEIAGVTVPVVELRLDTELHASSADIVVQDGEVASAEFGSARGRARLSAGKIVLVERDWQRVDLNDSPQGQGRGTT